MLRCTPHRKTEELTDEDKAAIKEASTKESPHPLLLKARLLLMVVTILERLTSLPENH